MRSASLEYRILAPLARGGMAELWLADRVGNEAGREPVVLKTLLSDLARHPIYIEIFAHEASLAARMNHPNLIQVFDFGRTEGRWFMAMDYVRGGSLRQMASHLGAVDAEGQRQLVLRAIADACEGLQYAHDLEDEAGRSLDVVHRDLSPENLMVPYVGPVKVIDFGVAASRSAPPRTLRCRCLGKLRYLAPECIQGEPADRRSDIYSLGVILYELLTGVRPFGDLGDDSSATLRRLACEELPHPQEANPALPANMAALITKAIARRPDERYAEARELGDAIHTCLDGGNA